MRLAKTRKLDVIAVWKLDRFGRSLRHLVDALAELKAVGCAFVSLRDNLDLTTPAGRMMFHVIGAMAEFERELIRERVKAGLAHARSKGQKQDHPKVRRDGDEDAKIILRMRAEGDSYGEIAEFAGPHKIRHLPGLYDAGVPVRRCKYRQPYESRLSRYKMFCRRFAAR